MSGYSYTESIILGMVQGIAEFLPISSSGHLVIAGELLNKFNGKPIDLEQSGNAARLQMNVAVHVGTLFSILWVYRADLVRLLTQFRLSAAVVLATLPLVAIGLSPLKDVFESAFQNPLAVGCLLWLTAALLLIGQRFESNRVSLDQLNGAQALVIGLFQALALFPGVSRSGSTIAGGLLLGLRRESAAAFSFFIAIPAISGAAVLTIKDALEADAAPIDPAPLIIGAATACLVGVISLKWLLRIVSQRKLHYFAYYCAAVGTLTLLWQLAERR